VIGLLIFTALMLAGCVFLVYFAVALWRDSRRGHTDPKVEITELPPRDSFNRQKANLLHMQVVDHFRPSGEQRSQRR
jgi:hypothetical protein